MRRRELATFFSGRFGAGATVYRMGTASDESLPNSYFAPVASRRERLPKIAAFATGASSSVNFAVSVISNGRTLSSSVTLAKATLKVIPH